MPNPPANRPDITKVQRKPRPKIKAKYAISQACQFMEDIQEIITELRTVATSSEDERTKCLAGQTVAKLTEAWCVLVDTRRELLGKPKAGTLRPDIKPAGRGKSRTILLPSDPPAHGPFSLSFSPGGESGTQSTQAIDVQPPDNKGESS